MPRDTVTNTVERIRRQLSSSIRMEVNRLGASVTTGSTITFMDDLQNSLRTGSILSIDHELMRVVTVNIAAKEAEVIRGWQDTDVENHTVAGEILVNPRFTRFDIFDAMIQEIDSWTPDLFQVEHVVASVTDEAQTLMVPTAQAGAIGLISARFKASDATALTTTWPELNYELQRGPADWPETGDTGLMVRFTDGYGRVCAGQVLLQLAIPFDRSTMDATTELSTLGISGGLLELLELGVKYRLMLNAETGHSQRNAQDEPRRAEEVQPREAASLGQIWMDHHARKRSHEVRTLRARYPMSQW